MMVVYVSAQKKLKFIREFLWNETLFISGVNEASHLLREILHNPGEKLIFALEWNVFTIDVQLWSSPNIWFVVRYVIYLFNLLSLIYITSVLYGSCSSGKFTYKIPHEYQKLVVKTFFLLLHLNNLTVCASIVDFLVSSSSKQVFNNLLSSPM